MFTLPRLTRVEQPTDFRAVEQVANNDLTLHAPSTQTSPERPGSIQAQVARPTDIVTASNPLEEEIQRALRSVFD